MDYQPTGALDEGLRLLQANDFTGAIVALQQAIQQNPQEGRAYGYLGMTYARMGDLNASLWALQEAVRLQPQDSAARYNLAVALAQAQRPGDAQTLLEQALALDPSNSRAQAALQRLAAGPAMPTEAPMASAQTPSPYVSTPPPAAAAAYPAAPTIMSLNGETVASASTSPYGEASSPVASLPSNYQTPPMMSGQPGQAAPYPGMMPPSGSMSSGGMGSMGSAGGMQYALPMRSMSSSVPPSLGKRILRGLGWGALYGQWWTLWLVFWDLIVHGSGHSPLFIVLATLVIGVFFAFVGSVLGLIVGLMDAMPDVGAIIGVVFGVLLLGAEYWLSGSSMIIMNIFFWGFTGRFIGRNIAARVQQPA